MTASALESILEIASEQTHSSVDRAYDEILNRIVSGQLRAGEPVKGALIAKETGLSRTPVMQAIARLNAEGVLNQSLNQRAVVAAGAQRWFVSIHEVRILLEPSIAASAAGRVPSAIMEELRGLAENYENEKHWSAKRESAYRLDFALHSSLAQQSDNLMVRNIVNQCMSFKRFAYRIPNDLPERLDRSHKEHLEILAAIEAGDAETARVAMLFHLRSTLRDLPHDHVV